MAKFTGRNQNVNDVASVTTVEVNDATATTLVASNDGRICLRISLDDGVTDASVFIRYYPSATDNIKQGEVLRRDLFGNSSINHSVHVMTLDNIYSGEISAISKVGTFNVHITEY